MSGPAVDFGAGSAGVADRVLEDGTGWDFFKKQMMPALVGSTFRPADDKLVKFARLAATPDGAEFVAWLHEISDRAPYPRIAGSIEEAALAASRHQGRATVGEMIEQAIKEGRRLIEVTEQKR